MSDDRDPWRPPEQPGQDPSEPESSSEARGRAGEAPAGESAPASTGWAGYGYPSSGERAQPDPQRGPSDWGSYGYPPPPARAGTNGFAIASLVLGIVGLVLSWFTFGVPSILAVIFGHVALGQLRRTTQEGRGMAIAGLTTGYVAIGIFLLFVVLVLGLDTSTWE